MFKLFLVIIFSALPFFTYSHSKGITYWGKPCSEIAERVFLEPTSPRKVMQLYLIDIGIKIPVFVGIKTIGAAVTRPANSFDSVYYYDGQKQSISVSFFDVDSDIDLLPKPKEISLFRHDGISVLFYETSHSKSHPQTPLFEAITPISYNGTDKFIMYATKCISEEEFRTLLSKLELNKN